MYVTIQIGSILEGKVTGFVKFGVFVLLPEGASGMVHISEITDGYVERIEDHLSLGELVRVKVIKIDEQGRIALSIKRAVESTRQKPKSQKKSALEEAERKTMKSPFDDMLNRYMQQSNEKLSGIKKSGNRRSGGGRGRSGREDYD